MDSFIYNLTKSPVSLWHFIPLGKGAGGSAPYGICPAPDCFQQQLDHCLEGLTGVYRIADDLLIIGQEDTDEKAVLDHDQNLKNLLERCRARNIKLNKRFRFKSRAMSFIGHVMIMNGLNAGPEKVEAVIKMEQPAAQWCNSGAEIHWASEVPVQVPTRPIRNVWAIVDIEHFIKLLNFFIQSFPVSACIVAAL